MKVFLALAVTGLMLGVSLLNADTLTNVGFPPPGGVTLGSSGSSISGSGKTLSYSNFNIDQTQYSAFYWGPTSIANVANSTDANQAPAQMAYFGQTGGTFEFDSTAPWELNSLQHGDQFLATRLLLTVTGAGAEDTEADLGASTAPSFPLFLISGDFTATFVFQADEQNVWTNVGDLYNSLNTNSGNQIKTSAGFSFFTDPVSTPEPGTWFLVGSGGIVVGLFRRRSLSSVPVAKALKSA